MIKNKFWPFFRLLTVLRILPGLILGLGLFLPYPQTVLAQNQFTSDQFVSQQYYLPLINAKISLTSTAPEMVVAIIDEGIDFSHPELTGKQFINQKEIGFNNVDDDFNEYVDDVAGWNFILNSNQMEPMGGHATRLAGIIAAEKNNGIGIEGIYPNAKLMNLIACVKDIGCNEQAVIRAIYYAANNGAQIINLSLGDMSGFKESYNAALQFAASKNVLVVVAAGGNEQGIDTGIYPVSPICNNNSYNQNFISNNNILGVSSLDYSGHLPVWANFGNCVDAYLPGVNIFTTFSRKFDVVEYNYAQGTSYSAAIASGLAARIKSNTPGISASEIIGMFKDIFYLNKPISIPQVKSAKIVIKKKTVPVKKYKTMKSKK